MYTSPIACADQFLQQDVWALHNVTALLLCGAFPETIETKRMLLHDFIWLPPNMLTCAVQVGLETGAWCANRIQGIAIVQSNRRR